MRVLKLLAIKTISRARWTALEQGWRDEMRKMVEVKVRARVGLILV